MPPNNNAGFADEAPEIHAPPRLRRMRPEVRMLEVDEQLREAVASATGVTTTPEANSNEGFAPEPPPPPGPSEIADRLLMAVQARQGHNPVVALNYIDSLLTTMTDIRTRAEAILAKANDNPARAQDDMYGLHSELGVFKSTAVPHAVHSFGKVIPNITRGSVNTSGETVTKEQILKGLEAIEKEFAGYRLERVEQLNRECFVVRTFNVILNHNAGEGRMIEFDFGPFDIALDLHRFERNQSKPYFCLAVEPHPAPSSHGVTHPHVSSNVMCEGNAGDVITKVLKRGDLYTFFVIVNQTLNVYNPHSPHVRLEDWGRRTDATYCYRCDGEISGSNRITCPDCGRTGHGDCMSFCTVVDQYLCNVCIDEHRAHEASCPDCDHFGEGNCLIRQNGTCSICSSSFEPGELLRCPAGHRSICIGCLDTQAEERNACCENASSGSCLLFTRMNLPVRQLSPYEG